MNRIRVGEQTNDDMELLKTRVRRANHPDLKEASLYIVCKRKDCAMINSQFLKKMKGESISIKAIHHHATQKNYKPYIEPKEGAVASTSFLDELELKIGAKIMIIHNIDTTDCLTNGQLGELIDTVKTTKGGVDKLIIKLNNKYAGQKNRSKHPGLAAKYPDCVIVERVSNTYTLRKRSGDVSTTATVIQFPVKVAFAITSHKIQGQTIPWPNKVVLDLDSIFEHAQAHVMLSRAQQISQIYILNRLDENKIQTSPVALRETKRLAAISINANPTPWYKENNISLKVVSLNCAGLQAHFRDIEVDDTIAKADIIHLIETSLEDNAESPLKLQGYDVHLTSVGRGKGIATLNKSDQFKHEGDLKLSNMQIISRSGLYKLVAYISMM